MKNKSVKTSMFKQYISVMEKKDKVFAFFSIVFVILSAICDLANPFVFAKIQESIGVEKLTAQDVPWYLFGVMCSLAVASLLFAGLYTYFSVKVSVNMSTNLRLKLFSKIQYLSSKNIDELTPSSLLTRCTSDIINVQTMLLNTFSIAIKSVCFIIGGFILSIVQILQSDAASPTIWALTSSYSLIFIFLFVVAILMKKGMPLFNKSRQAMDTNNALMSENILGNKIIRAFNLEKVQAKKFDKGNENLRNISIKAERILCVIMPFAFFVINFATVIIILIAGLYAKEIPVNNSDFSFMVDTIAVIFAFMQYFMLIMIGLTLVGMFVFSLSRGRVSSKRIWETINTEPQIKSGNEMKKIKNGNIEFKDVYFSYYDDENSKPVLSNINLSIKQGEWLGVIGQTGSGKSTLVNLITRLYDVKKGEVLVSGINVKDLDLDSLRDNISVSIQEKVLLEGTMKSNILAGKENATEKEIVEAAKLAEAYEFISKKENGFDAKVEQRGNNLSGGQKQRLSIARALIKKPKILIFDDSTSALDAITEKNIINNLYKHFKGTTVIFISQKVRSIQSCDQIIVLDNGKIVQHGKHKQLLNDKNGIYKQIYDSQNMSVEG